MTQPATDTVATAPTLPPDAQLLQLAAGSFISQAIYVAAKLGIADILANGPRSIEYISVATSTNENAIYRVLRAIASVGAFSELDGRQFENTPISNSLRTDHPRSTRDLTIWMNEEEHWRVYGHLMHSVKSGKPAFDHVHGEPIFSYLFQTNPELGEIFNRAMTSYSHQSIGPILEAYDFSGNQVIADIAGGFGHLLAAVLKEAPEARGILFDLPEVVAGSQEMFSSYGVADRVETVTGDFTESVPVEADIYLLKHIVHDWPDDVNLTILGNIRRAMKPGSKLLILDAVLAEANQPDIGKIIDLEMLMLPGGMERTANEFATLLNTAGFRLERIITTKGPVSIVEAVRAE
ncbi:MAG: methyltransferase [Pyrinomonadaceae bacterium]|nr:methyltransferase [Pyrinomonadaceae bacterium]